MEMKCLHSRHTTLKKERENDRPQCSKAKRQRPRPYAVQDGEREKVRIMLRDNRCESKKEHKGRSGGFPLS